MGKKPGPDPETVAIEGNWEEAVAKALSAKRPAGGWPKPSEKPKRPKKAPKADPKRD